jgi:sugar (pentulose or hexulose) kinase
MKCLAIDIGSTSIKGAVLDVAQQGVSHITSRPFPGRLPGLPAGYFEVDPREIETTARDVLAALATLAPDVERLYVAGQMGGLLLQSDAGEPLTNYLSWRDLRIQANGSQGPGFLPRLRERLGEEVLQSLGRELQAGSTLTLAHWLRENHALPERATPVTVSDYVISRLCSTPGHMHVTHAIGLLDLRKVDWHRQAFSILGVEQLNWPRLVRSLEPVGEYQIGDRTLAVYGAYGDQQCALFGAGLERGELSINISTGSQVSRRTEQLVAGNVQTRAYFEGDLLQTITHLPAGRSLNVLVQLLTALSREEGVEVRDPWSAISRLAESAAQASSDEAAERAVDLSFFAGPFGSTGSIAGITTENLTIGTLFLAAFRSMAANYARCAERIDPMASASRIVLSGSMAKSLPTLRRLIQQQFGAPFRDGAYDEETLLGLLKIASQDAA